VWGWLIIFILSPKGKFWKKYRIDLGQVNVPSYRGASVLALNRDDALAGGQLRAQEFYTSPRQFLLMPADVDSWLRPPAGAALPLISLGTTASLDFYH
jgi:hypothetical protein